MDIKLRLILLSTILALSACATKPKNDGTFRYADDAKTGDYLVDSGVQKARTKLAEAALSTSDSLNQLAAMEKVGAPRTKLAQPLDADRIGLGGLASVDWTGPIEPLVLKLANAGNYKFRAVGKNPSIPVLVAVYASNMPLADILRDANLQAGKKADVVVYPNNRLIELRYR
jgi:defect-in-organelle-trafficking protein DotD